MGPINCPKPPATIRTVEGRIYECHPQEGEDAYRDVTPPDEQTHWRMRFGSTRLPPQGTGSYHPPEDWPFRAIVSSFGSQLQDVRLGLPNLPGQVTKS